MDRRLEERLQDYLDGRMSADERARFEERLEQDADLAALVGADLETGNALRGGEEELSPGFYTRARAHFEASVKPERRRWFRLLSWETAGLTAAVVLAGVLFVPVMFRGDLNRQELAAVPKSPAEKTAADAAPPREEMATFADTDAEAETEGGEAVLLESVGYVDSLEKDEAPAVSAPAPKIKKSREAPPRPAEEDAQYAPAPPAARRQVEQKRAPATPMAVADDNERRDKSFSAGQAQQELIRGIPLPAGVVAPGGLRQVDTGEAWDSLRQEGGEGLAALGPFDPQRRLVLIGPRSAPFNCAWVKVRQAGGDYLVTLSPPDGETEPAPHGCGVPLPRDGRGVVVESFPPVE